MRIKSTVPCIALAAAALHGSAWLPAAEAGGRSRCDARHSRTVASNATARVYRIVSRSSAERVYGCLRATGRRRLVTASLDVDVRPGPFRLRRRVVAYAVSTCSRDDADPQCSTTLATFDIGTGSKRIVHPPLSDVARVTDLEVGSRRRLALIGERDGGGGVHAVYKHDSSGVTLLDEGTGIDRRSLRIEGATVSWVADGARRSATLG